MVIDFHTHAFPDKILEKAMGALIESSGNTVPFTDGSLDSLVSHAKSSGADYSVVQNIATNEKQQKSVNDFAIEINGKPGCIAFGSVHPFSKDALPELERIKKAGLKGIKLHPDYQGFFVNDTAVFPVYDKASELGLITVFHSGVDIGIFDPVHCTPEMLSEALPVFKGAPVVAAHFGGFEMWYDVEKYLVGKDIYFDTSYCYGRMPYLHARRIMESHGSDKILFGSDSPWSDVSNEINFVKAFAQHDDARKILGLNAMRLLCMEE